jgi:hypothetical protein
VEVIEYLYTTNDRGPCSGSFLDRVRLILIGVAITGEFQRVMFLNATSVNCVRPHG